MKGLNLFDGVCLHGMKFMKWKEQCSKVSYSRIPLRLGLEVFDNGRISEAKTDDFIKAMKAFGLISEIFHVNQLRACATSAMREAENGLEVRDRIKEETGINIEIISGDEEAELIFGTFFLLDFDRTIRIFVSCRTRQLLIPGK